MRRPCRLRVEEIRARALAWDWERQWQEERICWWNERLRFLNLDGKGGKPHLTKLFRCVVENLITFGHLNENQMWLWPRESAAFKERRGPCGLQARLLTQRRSAAWGDPCLPGSWGGVFRALSLDLRSQAGQGQRPITWSHESGPLSRPLFLAMQGGCICTTPSSAPP